MKHHGQIRDIESSGATLVELDSQSQCLRCQRGKGCGAVWFDPQRPGVTLRIETPVGSPAPSLPGASVGQSVVVEIDDSGSAWLWPVVAAYGLPLFGMLTATGITSSITGVLASADSAALAAPGRELVVLLSAALGLYGGILAWKKLSSSYFRRVLVNAERSLCLQSARIVAINPSSE